MVICATGEKEETMKNVVLLYNTCCIYEISILNYFLSVTDQEVLFVSLNGNEKRATEGYMIHPESALSEVKTEEVGSFIIPGGDIEEIDRQEVWDMLRLVKKQGGLLAGICAGVDVLEHAGILEGIISTHAADLDVAVSEQVITARANGYVDFAIEVAKKLDLFEDEADLQETIAFFRDHQRAD